MGFVFGRWLSAEAATDFTAAGVLGLLKSFDAFEATRADVCSLEGLLVAILGYLCKFQCDEVAGALCDAGRLLGRGR